MFDSIVIYFIANIKLCGKKRNAIYFI